MKHVYRTVAGLIIAFLCIPASGQADAQPPAATKKVNINSADSSQLCMLPRVGPSLADRIVEYRKDNGPFKKPEDLMLVQGVGEKTFQLIKPYVAISGETTLKEKAGSSRSSSGKTKGKSSRAKSGKTAKDKSTPPSSGGADKAVSRKVVRPAPGTPGKPAKKATKAAKPAKSTIRRGASGDGW